MYKGQAEVTGQEEVEVVARLLHWKGPHQNPWQVIARMYSECAADAYPNDWEEGEPLMAVAQHQRIMAAQPAVQAAAQPCEHCEPDDAAVDRFAAAMKAKLAKAREKGRGGWDDPAQCSVEFLAKLLVEHLSKGNAGTFEDVANFAMMLHQRGADPQVLAAAASPAQSEKAAHSAQWPTTPGLSAGPSEVQRLREALEWYAEKTKQCRKIGADGDNARQALDRDGGFRALDALAASTGQESKSC